MFGVPLTITPGAFARKRRPTSLVSLDHVGRVTRRLVILALVASGLAIWRERMLTANERQHATTVATTTA